MRTLATAVLLASGLTAQAAAGSISVVGTLATPTDVAFQTFTIGAGSAVKIQSFGYGGTASAPGGVDAAGAVVAAGGLEPHLSLFSGTGLTATFLASASSPGACPPATAAPTCGDPSLTTTLGPGSYTLAVSDFANLSFAENYGTGTLGDGFTDFAYSDFTDSYGALRTGAYAVDIVSAGLPSRIPSPGPAALAFGAALLFVLQQRKRSQP